MITIKEQAIKQIQKNLAKRGKGIGIKIGVKTTGCSGLAYVLEYVDETWAGSTSYYQKGFSVVIDNKDIPVVGDITLDYVRQGLNEGFEFTNPAETDRCGCGESFRINTNLLES
jgi:iron-sulfur cluster assembly protein